MSKITFVVALFVASAGIFGKRDPRWRYSPKQYIIGQSAWLGRRKQPNEPAHKKWSGKLINRLCLSGILIATAALA